MLSKNTIKYIQSLYQKKNRLTEKTFVVEGNKMVNEVLQSHFAVKAIYATDNWISTSTVDAALITTVTNDELLKISSVKTPQQVIAIVALPNTTAIPNTVQQNWSLVLDNIQDPGNLGTIIRLADWFGITHIICSNDTVDFFNAKVLLATMGSFIRVQCYYTHLPSFLQTLEVPIYGALLQGANIYNVQAVPGCIVIGNEGNGISKDVLPYIKQAITIPKKGKAESLNAAMAASIVVSVLCR